MHQIAYYLLLLLLFVFIIEVLILKAYRNLRADTSILLPKDTTITSMKGAHKNHVYYLRCVQIINFYYFHPYYTTETKLAPRGKSFNQDKFCDDLIVSDG